MMVGAVAAITGAGTFASFSASTTNDAAFSTARLALKNGTTCITPAGVDVGDGLGTASPDVNTNDEGCGALTFVGSTLPGSTATATVTIENAGDTDAALNVFADGACSVDLNDDNFDTGSEFGADELCDRLALSIYDDDEDVCLYGTGVTTPTPGMCPDMTNNSAQTFAAFTDATTGKRFNNKIEADDDLTVSPLETRTYKVAVRMKVTDNVESPGVCDADGFKADGVGCDNPYMNQKATFGLRWQLQA
jgi:hypothetical protein